jgi:translation initiation factor eIF-2B subunit delta
VASEATSSAAALKPAAKKGAKVVSLATAEMFAHLQQYRKVSVSTLLTHKDAQSIHPAVLQLGLRYADGTISGANARCVAMLHTLCQVWKWLPL